MTDRRALIKKITIAFAGGSLIRGTLARATQQPAPATQPALPPAVQPFDFAWLKGQAHWLASNAYQPSKEAPPPAMAKLGYDQYQSIRFRGERALWADAGLAFRVQFFHVGRN